MVEYKTTVCPHDCPDSCSVRVGLEDGNIVSIVGDPDHPITRGFLCGKVNRYLELLLERGLLEKVSGRTLNPRYTTTDQGRQVLSHIDEVVRALDPDGLG